MDIVSELLEKNNISKYQLSKLSGVPYSTISDICSGKTDIKKSSAETLVRISHVFKVKPEEMLGNLEYPEKEKTKSKKASKTGKKKTAKDEVINETKDGRFNEDKLIETFVRKINERIEETGELSFLVTTIKSNTVIKLFENEQKSESRYLLSLIDELCKKYNFPICREYDYIRNTD